MKASIIDLKVQYERKHDRLIDSLIWHFGGTIYELNVDLCMFYTCVILINLSYLCRYQQGNADITQIHSHIIFIIMPIIGLMQSLFKY